MGDGGAVKGGDRRNVQLMRWRREERHEADRQGEREV